MPVLSKYVRKLCGSDHSLFAAKSRQRYCWAPWCFWKTEEKKDCPGKQKAWCLGVMGENCSIISVRRGLLDKELVNITFVRLTRKTVQASTSRDAGRGNWLQSHPQALSTPALAINPEQKWNLFAAFNRFNPTTTCSPFAAGEIRPNRAWQNFMGSHSYLRSTFKLS